MRRILGYIEHRLQHRASFLALVLFIIGIIATIIFTLIESVLGPKSNNGFLKRAWDNLTFFVDPGRLTDISNPADLEQVFIIKLIMTILGILVFSTLIAIIAQVIDERISKIRSGIAPVRSARHTVFIGFSDKITLILSDSMEENNDMECIIYSDQDDLRMRSVLSDPLSRGQKILFKKGRNQRIDHSRYLNLAEADKVLILKEELNYPSHDSDIINLQLMVSLVTSDEWKKNKFNIVVEVDNERLFSEAVSFLRGYCDFDQANLPCRFSWNSTRSDIISATAQYPAAFDFFQSLFGFNGDDFHFLSYGEVKEICPLILDLQAKDISVHLKHSLLVALVHDTTNMNSTLAQEACVFPVGGCEVALSEGFAYVFISKDRKTLINDLGSLSRESLATNGEDPVSISLLVDVKPHRMNSISVIVNYASEEATLDLLVQIILNHPNLTRLKLYFLNSIYDEINTDFSPRLRSKIESVYEYSEVRLGSRLSQDRGLLGLDAMPLTSGADRNRALFYILSTANALLPALKEKIPAGAFLIGIHAVRSTGDLPLSIKWEDLDKCSGLLLTVSESPLADSHELIITTCIRALALAHEDEEISAVALWSTSIGGDVTFSHISTAARPVDTDFRASHSALVDFEQLAIETHVLGGIDDILSEVSLYDEDAVLWLNDDLSVGAEGVSIDPLSERLHWILRDSTAFSKLSLFEDPLDYLMDALEETETRDYHSALLCVANANTAKRINRFNLGYSNHVDTAQIDIGAFDSNSLASSILSSLLVDHRYSKLLDALRTGELTPVFIELICREEASLRTIMSSFGKEYSAVPIAFRNKDASSVRFNSISENLDTSVRGELVLLCLGNGNKRLLLAPHYTF